MNVEVWKDIPDYENYQVSNFGRVKSKRRIDPKGRLRKEKFLRFSPFKKGYLGVKLYGERENKTIKVHRLVCLCFKGKSSLHVDHIDGDPKNNNLKNLEYVTNRENALRGRNCDRKIGKTSKYRNVSYCHGAFVARVKNKYLGRFKNEYDAYLATIA